MSVVQIHTEGISGVNAWQLLRELKSYLEPHLAILPLPVRGRNTQGQPAPLTTEGVDEAVPALRPASVYVGSMPPTVNDALSAAPFVVLQAMGGYDENGLHHITVALRLCIVSDDLEGAEQDLHALISLLRLRLQHLPDKVLAQRFRITEGPDGYAPWERPDEQVIPFLQAHIMTLWQTKGVSHVSGV